MRTRIRGPENERSEFSWFESLPSSATPRSHAQRHRRPIDALSRPDALLLFIPLALTAGAVLGLASPLSIGAGSAIGSLVASVAVVDGVALNPPTE